MGFVQNSQKKYELLKVGDCVGREVFIVATNQNGYTLNSVLFFKRVEDVLGYLKSDISIDLDNDVKIFHGTIAPAKVLPESIKEIKAYLIAADGNDRDICIRNEEYTDIEELQEEITYLLRNESGESIEYLYILYGYELNPFITIDTDEIDDGELEECKNTVHNIMDIIKPIN